MSLRRSNGTSSRKKKSTTPIGISSRTEQRSSGTHIGNNFGDNLRVKMARRQRNEDRQSYAEWGAHGQRKGRTRKMGRRPALWTTGLRVGGEELSPRRNICFSLGRQPIRLRRPTWKGSIKS